MRNYRSYEALSWGNKKEENPKIDKGSVAYKEATMKGHV